MKYNDYEELMLTSKRIHNFFKKNPNGFIDIIQSDKNFRLTKDISFSVDSNSITLIDCVFNTNIFGNELIKKRNFLIPFKHIMRIEFIEYEK